MDVQKTLDELRRDCREIDYVYTTIHLVKLLTVLADHQRRIAELEARLDAGEANPARNASGLEVLTAFAQAWREAGETSQPTPVDDPNDPARRRR